MRGLLLKDFKIGFKYIVFMILIIVLTDLLIVTDSNILPLYIRVILNMSIYSYVSSAITFDMVSGVDMIICSLPISKKKIVAGKYLNILVGIILGVISTGILMSAVWLIKGINMWGIIDIKNLLFMIGMIVIVLLVMIPSTYKYGAGKSKIVVMIFMSLIIIISVALEIPMGFFDEIGSMGLVILIGTITFAIMSFISYSISVKNLEERDC